MFVSRLVSQRISWFLIDVDVLRRISLICSHARYFSGLQSAAMAIVVSYAYLETLFAPVKLPFDAVALNILVITSGFVGMCLGVLLPRLFPGVTLGYSTSLLLGMFIPLGSFYFPISGTLLAVAFSYTSIK